MPGRFDLLRLWAGLDKRGRRATPMSFFFCHSFLRPQEVVQVGGLLRSPRPRGGGCWGPAQKVLQGRRVALALLRAYKRELKE